MRNDKNGLYLLKLAAKVKVVVCHWHIVFTYDFPVFDENEFMPRRVFSLPKKINGGYYQLETVPYVITWAERLYSFSQEEFDQCEKLMNVCFAGHQLTLMTC